tara:strand:+ start:480 stop:1025 length:546 start_codon:yes stop_codon:yes gene_type:complete
MIWTPLDNSFCYIGSTFNRLHKRFEGHKNAYKYNYGNFTIHKYFDTYGVDNFKIDLIKTYDVIRTNDKDRKHLHAYETLWINKTKNCINSNLPFNPLFKIDKKICLKKYYEKNKEKFKEHYEKNKDDILEYAKNYKEQNRDKIRKDKNEKFNCECGGKYTKCHKVRHFKSKKHQNYLNNNN